MSSLMIFTVAYSIKGSITEPADMLSLAKESSSLLWELRYLSYIFEP